MKLALFVCAAMAATLPISFAVAATSDDDIVILAVKPRSADVKPIAASVSVGAQDAGKSQAAPANVQVSRR